MSRKIAEKYAQALFETARENETLDQIETELQQISRLAEENEEFKQLLKQPELTIEDKKSILVEAVGDKTSTYLLNFLKLLVDKKRAQLIPLIYQVFSELVDKEQDRLEVTVESPVELPTEQQKRLKEKLNSILDKEIKLKTEVNSELMAGLVLKTKHKVIDLSLLNHLESLKSDLKNLEVR